MPQRPSASPRRPARRAVVHALAATFFALVAAALLGAIALIACGRGSSCEMQRSETATRSEDRRRGGKPKCLPEPWVPAERICTLQLTQRMGSRRGTDR